MSHPYVNHPYVNDVELVGRLSGAVEHKSLPSGDMVLEWRIVVERPPDPRYRKKVVDTIQCVTYDRRFRDITADWRHGDLIEVRGAIRRRFWRTGGGEPVSRYDVEVREVDLLAVAPDSASVAGTGTG